jgi:PAS domain S-box-containing protein
MAFTNAFMQISLPAGLTTLEEGRYIGVSDSFLQFTGLRRDDVIGVSSIESGLLTIEQRSHFLAELNSRGRVENVQMEVRLKDGSLKQGLFHAVIMTFGGGKKYLLTVMTDITALKSMEAELRESEEKLKMALQGADMGLWDLDLTTMTGTIDERAARILGYHKEDIPPEKVAWDGMTHPDDVRLLQENIQAHLEGLTPGFESEHRLRTAEGKWKWVHGRGRITRRGTDGSPVLISGTMHDISRRKEAEEALRRSEEKLRLITDNMSDMIRVIDLKGTNLYVSPSHEKGLGYRAPNRTGRSSFDIIHPEDVERTLDALAESLASDRTHGKVEYRVRHADGHYLWLETTADLLRDAEGNKTGLVLSSRDVTSRKLAEEQLRNVLEGLEAAVRQRTAELNDANAALRVLLNRRLEDQKAVGERLQLNVNELILPVLEELRSCGLNARGLHHVDLLKANLMDIASPFISTLSSSYRTLTPREIEVANMIREGKKTKEIAEILGISAITVDSHRISLRKKLGLSGEKVNLRSQLLAIK